VAFICSKLPVHGSDTALHRRLQAENVKQHAEDVQDVLFPFLAPDEKIALFECLKGSS
jgi:hypothetical protein